MDAIRLFYTGAQVNSIIWHPLLPDYFVSGSTNGNIHAVILKRTQVSSVMKYICPKSF